MKKENKILQIKLWENCENNCTFCYLNKNRISITSEEKLKRIDRLKELLTQKARFYSKVGLIGGELFQGQLKGLEKSWTETIELLDSLGLDQVWLTASLMTDDILDLINTLNIFSRTDVLVCTSWDAKGRFNSRTKDIWLNNVEKLHSLGFKINVTSIITQDLLEADKENLFNIPEYCLINLCDPYLSLEWYNGVDKKNYHKHLLEDNKLFNLPKRQDFLSFLVRNPRIIRNYADYSHTHSTDIIDLDNRALRSLCTNRVNRENEYSINKCCGHPYFSQCYSDSDACAMCDAERILDSLGD